ncbi:ABC transporter substrate-binding protein [Microvirga brassicacearum]|uniref:ABC transporter substrate-binding protein n=1 Tax=Microvirga brassicacearum TaxID=2580413 RepID=A0A5N3PE76_9HYPH|nr:ABC transporter substrate-binding protein [Microvirga brassicacearum]KAB0268014.1 ABC transporter substrate-binding protein [Microvirga brassicacearum]
MKKHLIGLLLSATLAISGSVAAHAEPKYGGILKLQWGTLDTADFHRHTGTISLPHPFAETLTTISKDGQPKGLLAEKWDISSDGRTYTFAIRKGVKFHNGRILTAQDVKKNLERIEREVKGGWLTSAMQQVESMETPDANTLVVHFKAPFAPFVNLLAEAWILAPESPGWDSNITKPIGTGPFTFDSWTPQLKITGAKFKDYWMEGKPYVDGIKFDVREVGDASLALRAGDYHAASIPLSKIKSVEAGGNIRVEFRGDTSWNFLSFNNRKPRPPFDNIKVREAVAYALDKKALLNQAAGEYGTVGNQMVDKGNFFFDAEMAAKDKHAKPDLERAKKILAAEGVDPGKTTIYMISEITSRTAAPIAQVLRQLGFKVDNKSFDDLGFQKALSAYDWDVFPGGSGPRNDIFLRYVRLTSDGPNPGLWGGVQDKEFDTLVTAAISAVDQNESRALYLKAWQRVIDNYYTVVLGHSPGAYGIRSEVKDLTIGFNTSAHRADGGVAFAWIER